MTTTIIIIALVSALAGIALGYLGCNYDFDITEWWFDITYKMKKKC